MPDFLDVKRQEIDARLAVLKPVVDEYGHLESAAAVLADLNGSSVKASRTLPASTPRRGPGRPRGSASRAGSNSKTTAKAASKPAPVARRRGGRPKGSGPRATEAVALIHAQPGVTTPELAMKMGIKQNYLYRVLPGLAKSNKVVKKGRGWHPKA